MAKTTARSTRKLNQNEDNTLAVLLHQTEKLLEEQAVANDGMHGTWKTESYRQEYAGATRALRTIEEIAHAMHLSIPYRLSFVALCDRLERS